MGADPRVIAAIARLGVAYDVMACDPEYADTAAFCQRYGIDPADSANAIVVASRRAPRLFVACVALATTRLDVNGTIRRRMGVAKVSFASAADTVALTGMQVGGVTPFGLPADLPVWIDAAVLLRDQVVVGAGSRSAKLRVAPDALAALPAATVVEDLARLAAPDGDDTPGVD